MRAIKRPSPIEPAVWDLVLGANMLGLFTRSACEGHTPAELPFVMFGFDYPEGRPGATINRDRREANLSIRRGLEELLLEFNALRSAPAWLRLRLTEGWTAEAWVAFRARTAEARAEARRASPERFANTEPANPYEGQDTCAVEVGKLVLLDWLMCILRLDQRLRARQTEMRAFGQFVLAQTSDLEPVSVPVWTAARELVLLV